VHLLANKDFDSIKMQVTTVKKTLQIIKISIVYIFYIMYCND